ncbi:ZFP26-like protein [Mya arenaria]|uniref:ZFP26-like protein n=1 Tax=Mya arenaria TaxID=6604 RepID=A0ABY7FIF4_MYAAR|nr:ZFP26-like protein [Mya arenaria]
MDGEEMAEDDKGVAIYIVQQEGTDVEGMTYTVVENEGAEGQPMSLDAIMGGGSVTMVTENGEEQALPPSQYHVLQQLEVIKTEGDNYSVLPTAEDTSTGPDQSLSYYCQFCGSILVSLNELKSHMAERHNASIEVEEMDGIVYDEANQSEVDNKNRTEDEGMTIELCCSMCNLVFDDKDKLEAHMYDKHSMENLDSDSFLKCPFCPRMFAAKWQNSLYEHLKEKHDSHTGPIEVEVVKMKAAKKRSKDAYRPSPMYSEKEAEATCHLCNLTFKHKKNLPIHLTKYHQMSEKEIEEILGHDFHIPTMFSCPVCSKQFLWPATLKRHMLEHDPEGKSPNTRRNVFFRCLYCPLTTRYACSVRKHISRIHPEKVKDIDINKLSIPKFTGDVPDDVKENVITLDKRPAEEKYKDFAVVYICPFCDYVTQLPSNLSRHLTSKAHNKIFTSEELKAIKVSSFKVKKGSNTSELPKLQLDRKVRDIVNVKRKQMELPPLSCDETDLDIFDDDERENEEEQEDPSYDPRRDSKGMTAPLKVYGVSSNKSKEIVSPVSSLTGKGSVCVLGKDGTVKKLFPKSVAEISVKQEAETEEMITGTTTEDTLDDTETIPEQVEDIGEVGREKGEKQTQTDNMDAVKAAPDSERIKCLKCPLRFADIQSLLKHIVLHKNVVLDFSCQICKEKFPFYSELLEHDEKVHKGKMGTTNVMKAVAMSSINTSRKPMTTYDCPYCEMLFGQPGSLDKHARLDHKEHLKRSGDGAGKRDSVCGFNCYFCELSFFSILQLVEHMQAVHPNAERPGQVEFSDLSARKSSRKRKLPKWLEKDMEFGEEVKKKKSELPVRVGSIQVLNAKPGEQKEKVAEKADDAAETLASKKNVPVAHSSESVPTSKAKDDDKEVTVDVSDGRVVKHSTKKRIQSEKATQSSANVLTKHPIDRKSDENKSQTDAKQKTVLKQKQNKKMAMLHTKEKASTPKKLQDESLKEVKSSVKRKRQTQSVNLEDIIVDSPAAKCPHCSFVAKRSSALAFHINMNHPDKKVIKKEVDEESLPGDINDEPIDDNLATDKDYQYTGPKSKHKTEAIQTDELRNEKREDYQDGDSDLESDIDLMDLDISGDITDRGCVEVNDGEEVREFAVEVNEEENRSVWRSGLYRHMRRKHKDEKDIFTETFYVDLELNKGDYCCPHCTEKFDSPETVVEHSREHHPEKCVLSANVIESTENAKLNADQFQCPYCDMTSQYTTSITRHVARHHPSRKKSFHNSKILRLTGDAGHVTRKVFGCEYCSYETDYRSCLNRHVERKHPIAYEEYKVRPVKPRETQHHSKVIVRKFPKKVIPASKFVCIYCQHKLESDESLKYHVASEHNGFPVVSVKVKYVGVGLDTPVYSCPQCQLMDLDLQAVASHIQQHDDNEESENSNKSVDGKQSGLQVYVCNTCSKAYESLYNLVLHSHKSHGKDAEVMFKMVKLGGDNEELVNKYNCPICSFISVTRDSLVSHLQSKHGIADVAVSDVGGMDTLASNQSVLHNNTGFKCPYCNVCMQKESNIFEHIVSKHPEKSADVNISKIKESHERTKLLITKRKRVHQCVHCNMRFRTSLPLRWHMRRFHPKVASSEMGQEVVKYIDTPINASHTDRREPNNCPEVQCELCLAILGPEKLTAHLRGHCIVKSKFECNICTQTFPSLHQRHSHICQKVFYTKKAMFKHGQLHTLNRDVPISPVRPSLQNDPDLYEPLTTESQQDDADPALHVIHIGQDTVQYLPKMGDSSLNAVIKELIVYNQSGDLPYKCVLCNRQFAKMKYIKLHIRRAHVKDENQPYRCKVCGSGFVRLTEFRKHTRSHSDFRPFKCKFCNKAFKQQANLKEHLFVHDNIKHFQCYLCSKWFRQRGALTSHVVLHDKLKPFKCTFCGKGFTTRGELGRHMKRYESEERRNEKCYSCYLCMKAFPHFPLLMKHIDQHNPEKPFTCEICTDTFSNYVALYFHKVKYQHVLETEVVQVQHTENPSRLKYKPSVLYEDGDVVYVNQTLDGHMIENDGSSGMEVVIHNIDKHGGIQFTEKHPEQDELLSIAQQLTELSNIPKKKGSANPSRKEEDEIVKTMLDADADVMASLTKTSTSDYTSASSAPPGRRPTVRDLLEDNYTYSSSHSVPEPQEPEYTVVNDFPVTGEYQMDMTTQALVSCPSNMEELASLIVQQSDTSDQDNMLAIQDEDGSIIYVCLPQGTGVDQNVEETTVPFAEMDTNSMGASVNVQNVVVLSENETNDYTEHFEETQPDPNTMENIVIEASNIQEDLETPIDAENHDQNNYVIEAEHVESTISSTFAENINPTINPTQTEAESSENISTEEIITTQTSVEEIPQEIITSTVLENPPPSRLLQVLASGDAVSSSPLATALLAGTTPGIGAEGEHSGEIIEGSQLVPIDNDDSNFTQEELLDIEYQQNLEDNDDVMVMQGKFRYTFDKNEKKFTCLHCNATLCNYKNLKGHLKRHMPRETFMFKCDQCESRFCSNNELTRHVRVHTREKNYACPMCDKMFIQKGHLDTHMRMHQGIKPYKCDQCDARFITSSQRKVHWTRKHGNSEIPCDQCDLTFKTQVDMYQHKGRYHVLGQLEKGKDKAGEKDGGVHVCEKCGKKFGNRRSLLHHLFEHSVQDKVHKCQECTQEFRSRELLREHAKQEHENHVYVCNQCGEAFLNRKFLNAHMKENHPQEYEASSSKTSVKEPCKICGKLFAKGVSMMYHLGSQHADAVLGESSNSSSSTEQS